MTPGRRADPYRRVLVDTGAWLAAFHRRDQYHAEASRTLRRLRAGRVRLVVTDLILAELHLHLLHAFGPGVAAAHVRTLLEDPGIVGIFCDGALEAAALGEWIGRYADQRFSLTDAGSFAVMRARGIPAAFTFDHHFRVAGFPVVG